MFLLSSNELLYTAISISNVTTGKYGFYIGLYNIWQTCTQDKTGLSNPFGLLIRGNRVTMNYDFSPRNSPILPDHRIQPTTLTQN